MANEFKEVVFGGNVHSKYKINREGQVVSVFGNTLTITKGYVTLNINGKRKSIKIESLLDETFNNVEEDVYYDLSTKNTSFVEVHKLLREQGIENNKFFLALYNKNLAGINPHYAAHKKEVRWAIIEECKKNPWYFLREVVRFRNVDNTKKSFILNQANLANTFLSLLNISSYTVTPRSTFRTRSASALLAWFKLFGECSEISITDTVKENADAVSNIVRDTISLAPKYIRDYVEQPTKVVSIESPLNTTQASTIARSNNAHIQLFDNFEFIRHNAYLILEGNSNFLKFNTEAAYNNTSSFRMLLSTVGREDNVKEKFIDTIIKESVEWENSMYDDAQYLSSHINVLSPIAMVYIEFSAEDIVVNADEYYTHQEMMLKGSDEDTIAREVYLRRSETISVPEEVVPAETDYIESGHEWYEGTEIAAKATSIYQTIDTTVFENGIPAIVVQDLLVDGHTDVTTLAPYMARAYIIRRIATVLATGMNADVNTVYENEYDTYFATFGVTNPALIGELFNTNEVARRLYMGILFVALPLLSMEPEISFAMKDAGPFSAKSFHLLTNLVSSVPVQ